MKKVLALTLLLLVSFSCGHENRPESCAMELQTAATKASPVSDWPCYVVMHKGSAMENIGEEEYEPYFKTWFSSVFDYSPVNGKFNTKLSYPSNYDYVCMSGFSPAMEEDNGDVEDAYPGWLLDMCDHYQRIRVNYGGAYDNSKWEGIASAGPKTGSSISPFKSDSDALDFHFSAFRVKIRAIRSKNMSSMGVHNVYVTIRSDYVPYSLEWDEDLKTYVPKGKEGNYLQIPLDNGDEYHMISQDLDDGSEPNYAVSDIIYLCKSDHAVAMPHIHLDLHAEFTTDTEKYTGGFTRDYPDVQVEVKDSSDRILDDIQPGNSYVITIVFDQDSFTIEGVSEGWEEGGNVNVQIQNPITS